MGGELKTLEGLAPQIFQYRFIKCGRITIVYYNHENL